MNGKKMKASYQGVTLCLFAFEGTKILGKEGKPVNEYFCMYTLDDASGMSFEKQVDAILDAESLLTSFIEELKAASPVFKRIYLSDAANQAPLIKDVLKNQPCAVSVVQQPPLNGSKFALWSYMMTGSDTRLLSDNVSVSSYGGYDDIWLANSISNCDDSYSQAYDEFTNYASLLAKEDCTMEANCIRTWLYVSDIDNRYAGVVKARNDVFDMEGLTDKTHYIASTGIGGVWKEPRVFCKMDALAVKGITRGQVHYLYALDHLNRTSDYGVRFERGTYVDYPDRRRVYISGTASIDNKGNVVFPGDIHSQTLRMWENIEALLKEADCTFDDVAMFSVYLRDVSDRQEVEKMFREKFPDTPYIILYAPVCRPGWLIESECIAVKSL